MSEHDEHPPLTRRARRLQELAETGALDLSDVGRSDVPSEAPAAAPEVDAEIEISPLNDDGTPRSRREMRQLREALLAERAEAAPVAPEGAAEPASEPDADTDGEHDSSVEQAAETETAADAESEAETDVAPEAETGSSTEPAPTQAAPTQVAPAESAPDFDTLIAPPTEPFTIEDLKEAESAAAQSAETAEAESDEAIAPSEEPAATDASSVKPKRRFWQRGKSADADAAGVEEAAATEAAAPVEEPAEIESAENESAESVEAVEPESSQAESADADAAEAADVTDAVDVADVADADVAEEAEVEPELATGEASSDPEPVAAQEDASEDALPAEQPDVEPATVAAPIVAEPVAPVADAPTDVPSDADAADEPTAATGPKTTYSFPDIQPPEEWRSVFDDPSARAVPVQGKSSGDFDDLISRAVAQEGNTGSSTSALILPSMPDETGGLSGPLGGTGELYLTGSIELPKSLGETGGHSSLHDSIEMDPIVPNAPIDPKATGEYAGPAPVSARHAVSARVPSGVPVVAKPAKEQSKLPVILALSGGGLLIVVVGLGVWGATNGFFG